MEETKPTGFFKQTNTFRLSPAEVVEFNQLFTDLHPVNKPSALRELFVNMFKSYVNKPANTEVNAGANVTERKQETDSINTENGAVNEIAALKQRINDLESELHIAAQGQQVLLEMTTLLSPLKIETEQAFVKEFFEDPEFKGMSFPDFCELLLDYARRDPSKEFPFEPVARVIYERNKTQSA